MSHSSNKQHPLVAEMVASLDETQREAYEERAAILEFDAGVDRHLAEAWALLEVIKKYRWNESNQL
ncbi:hypothetical protein [Azonexus hydrophilus]|uniref:hypothetical protein n=1 Tax=Azonexus hydrophilus TaxID=418702 RepID=UPI0019644E8D|nr:hypothetical protein [Azonexus hydrophilus]